MTISITRRIFLVLALTNCLSAAAPENVLPAFKDVKRIVFLGDSITQAGDYVTDVDCWFVANRINVEVLNLGLSSETASDLSEAENSDHLKKHGFGRPAVSERLERLLVATRPDWVIACYGMNDGSSLPSNDVGTRRFAEAVTRLRDAALKAGVKRVILCTPPVRDAKGDPALAFHDENIGRYSDWLVSKRSDAWDVVDIHSPMRKALVEGQAKDPAFLFSKDGVHPGREGHWLMAREILSQGLGAKPGDATSAADLFPAHGDEIRKLVFARMKLRFDSWMTRIGHLRPATPGGPGVPAGLTFEESVTRIDDLSRKIQELVEGVPSEPVGGFSGEAADGK